MSSSTTETPSTPTNSTTTTDSTPPLDHDHIPTSTLLATYAAERLKRLRPDGLSQYIFLDRTTNPTYLRFAHDPYLTPRSSLTTLHPNQRIKHLILGAGIGGLLAGINIIKAGVSRADEIWNIDTAGGWGGAWWHNRYPGVACDVESYVYLPLLQETGYVPRHRYSYGPEIRRYLEGLAKGYGLDGNAMFRTKVESAVWDEGGGSGLWGCVRGGKLPGVVGIEGFKGEQFHIGRWDYGVTGGSDAEVFPVMDKLRDKRVAIVGTRASAVQATVELAKYAKGLLVVQRTPAGVDTRSQEPTDPKTWKEVVTESGRGDWWERRNQNMAEEFSGTLKEGEKAKVNDETTHVKGYRVVFGGKDYGITPDNLEEYVKMILEEDRPRMDRVRRGVREKVKDKETVERLTPWYPSWCKRSVFHDEYLDVFNNGNVALVDTNGKGIEEVTAKGFRANDREYEVDIIVWATGYRGPLHGWAEQRSGMVIKGRNGKSFDEKWDEGVASLHGAMTEGFPNLFLSGILQAGATLNWSWVVEVMTEHAAYIAKEAERRAKEEGEKDVDFSVEPTKEAEEAWTMEVLKRAGAGAALASCTPNYFNDEGAVDNLPMEAKMKMARGSPWGPGILDYKRVIHEWRAEGSMKGMKVEVGRSSEVCRCHRLCQYKHKLHPSDAARSPSRYDPGTQLR